MTLPAGYEPLRGDDVEGFAWGPARPWVERALLDHGSLRRWASSLADGEPLAGRGTVLAVSAPVPGPDGHERWAVRRYLRGGQVARVLGDRYLKGTLPRPTRELRASCACRRRGVSTPAAVAGAVYPAGPLYYRADFVTELVPASLDLAAVLFGPPEVASDPEASEALEAAGVLLARTAARGILHADLNAKNIVLTSTGGAVTAHLIDLDRCRVRERARAKDAAVMRRRLERSLRKHATRTGHNLDDTLWHALERGIERGATTGPRSNGYDGV